MVKNFIICSLLICGEGLFAADQQSLKLPESSLIMASENMTDTDELKIADQLIVTTRRQLEMQKNLKDLMVQFRDQKESFVQGNQTKEHAGKMVRTARQIYEIITANHLEYVFPKDYLDELTFFSSIAGKSGISKP